MTLEQLRAKLPAGVNGVMAEALIGAACRERNAKFPDDVEYASVHVDGANVSIDVSIRPNVKVITMTVQVA